jgi:hypothetical protein
MIPITAEDNKTSAVAKFPSVSRFINSAKINAGMSWMTKAYSVALKTVSLDKEKRENKETKEIRLSEHESIQKHF